MSARRLSDAALLAAGWRRDGDAWYPPWPCPYSFTLAAAKLEQGLITERTPKRKSKPIIPPTPYTPI